MRLKELRLERKLTQGQMAEVLGCNQVTYLRYENELHSPSIPTLIKLADFFHTTVDYLIENDSSRTADNGSLDALIRAAKRADERAVKDATELLLSHSKEDK